MNQTERLAYEQQLRSAAKRLGLPARGNIEQALIQFALNEIGKWIAAHGVPSDLTELLQGVAASMNLEIIEIHDDADLEHLRTRTSMAKEPVVATLSSELDDQTDAVILQRLHREPWERPFLAVINCKGWHGFRKYFSKWHEVVHLVLDGKQLRLAFRKRASKRKHPEEILVDKIAGAIAFYPPIFEPIFRDEVARNGGLSFQVVDAIRNRVAPEASREATLVACLKLCEDPVYFVQASLGYKASEERQAHDLLAEITGAELRPQPKLRITQAMASPVLERLGIRLHERMRVPGGSIVSEAFEDADGKTFHGDEQLETWQTSQDGPIGVGRISVEAVRYGSSVWALISLRDGEVGAGARPSKKNPKAGHEGELAL